VVFGTQKFLYRVQWEDDFKRAWTKAKSEFPEDMSEACHATTGRQVELCELCEVGGLQS